MTEVISLLGISEKQDIVDDCVPFTGEGICPTCKHKHKTVHYDWNYGDYKPYKPKSESEWNPDFHSIWATTYPPEAINK